MPSNLVKQAAMQLAKANGYDPNEYWEDFDRNAAATVSNFGDYEGWEEDVFPRTYRWQDYESQAAVLVEFIVNKAANVAFEKSTHPFDTASDIANKILELKNDN